MSLSNLSKKEQNLILKIKKCLSFIFLVVILIIFIYKAYTSNSSIFDYGNTIYAYNSKHLMYSLKKIDESLNDSEKEVFYKNFFSVVNQNYIIASCLDLNHSLTSEEKKEKMTLFFNAFIRDEVGGKSSEQYQLAHKLTLNALHLKTKADLLE